MPVERPQAFISYTSDLKPECDAVFDLCNDMWVVPFDYQRVGANGNSPEEYLDRELALSRSDIYLGILGGRHGSLWPPPADRSAVEGEFERFRGQPGLRRTAVFHKQLPAEQIEPLQALFRSRTADFKTGVWKRDFDSIQTLCAEVRRAIEQFLAENHLPLQRAQEKQRKKWQPVIVGMAAVCAALVVITAIVSLATPMLPREISMVIISCLATAIMMSLLFVQFVL
jgi:uncharacterized protein DUF4062